MIWKIFHPFYRIRIQYIKNDYIDISVIDINFYRTSHFSKLINQSLLDKIQIEYEFSIIEVSPYNF